MGAILTLSILYFPREGCGEGIRELMRSRITSASMLSRPFRAERQTGSPIKIDTSRGHDGFANESVADPQALSMALRKCGVRNIGAGVAAPPSKVWDEHPKKTA